MKLECKAPSAENGSLNYYHNHVIVLVKQYNICLLKLDKVELKALVCKNNKIQRFAIPDHGSLAWNVLIDLVYSFCLGVKVNSRY